MNCDNSQNRASNGHDDEVTFADLWAVLARRKIVALGTLVFVLLCAALFMVFSKPVYESRAVIQVGQVGLVGPVEESTVLVQRLQAENPLIEKIEEGKGKGNSIVTVTVRAFSQAEASQRLRTVADALFTEHKVRFDAAIAVQQEKYASVRQRLDSVHALINDLSLLVDELIKKKEPTQATILVLEKSNLVKSLAALEENAIVLNRNMGHPLSMPTSFIAEPVTPDAPIKPKPRVIIPLSVILGILLSGLSAFVAEFIDNTRHKVESRRV